MEAALIQTIGATAATIATVLGTLVTAVATVFLWRVTRTLAGETKRMAEASAQPQVVAHIEPNRWAHNHADLHVANTGNGTAFDIQVTFDPPLERDKEDSDQPIPLQRISVLKPGQKVSSWIGEWGPLLKKTYSVQVSWKRHPSRDDREALTYTLDMNDVEGMSWLGASDPMIQVAEQIKKIREDWQRVPKSGGKLHVDVFSSDDRRAERETLERMRAERRSQAAAEAAPPKPDET